MKRTKSIMALNVSKKARPLNPTTAWAAGGQNPMGKMNGKQKKLMAEYLRYLEANKKQ